MAKEHFIQMKEKFFTVKEFIAYTNGCISYSGTYKKIRKGIIPATKIDSKTYIPKIWVYQNYDKRFEIILAKVAE